MTGTEPVDIEDGYEVRIASVQRRHLARTREVLRKCGVTHLAEDQLVELVRAAGEDATDAFYAELDERYAGKGGGQ